MTSFDVQPDQVTAVVGNTTLKGEDIATAINGGSNGTQGGGITDACNNFVNCSQSALAGTALSGYFDNRKPKFQALVARVGVVTSAAVAAVDAIKRGDEQMAAKIQANMNATDGESVGPRVNTGGATK